MQCKEWARMRIVMQGKTGVRAIGHQGCQRPKKPDAKADARLMHTIRTVGERSRNIIRKGQVHDRREQEKKKATTMWDGNKKLDSLGLNPYHTPCMAVPEAWVQLEPLKGQRGSF